MSAMAVTLLVMGISIAGPQAAGATDDWDGTSYLQTTAAEANVQLSTPNSIDWTTITTDDVIVIADSASPSCISNALRFIEDGGNAIILVEPGTQSTRILEPLGLKTHDTVLDHDAYYQEHPAFPILTPDTTTQDEFLWFNVERIVGNHPVTLVSTSTSVRHKPLITYRDPNHWFTVEMEHGRGHTLVVGDGSLLINDMQRHLYGDKQFVANLFRYFCDSNSPCQVTYIGKNTDSTGRWTVRVPDGIEGIRFLLARGIESLERGVAKVTEPLKDRDTLFAITVLLILLIGLSCLYLPWRPGFAKFAWNVSPPRMPTERAFWVTALERRRLQASFTRPTVALLRNLERLIVRESPDLAHHPLDDSTSDQWVATITTRCGPNLREPVLHCLEALIRVQNAASAEQQPHFALREFQQIWIHWKTISAELSRKH